MRKLISVLISSIIVFSGYATMPISAAKERLAEKQIDPKVKYFPKDKRKPYIIKRSCDEVQGNCPKLDTDSLIKTSFCKIEDQTKDWRVSSGFPRHPSAIQGKANLKILVMVFELSDRKYPLSAYKNLQKEARETEKLLRRISNQFITIKFVFPEYDSWTRFKTTNEEFNQSLENPDKFISKVLGQGAHLNPSSYDAIYLHTPIGFEAKFRNSYAVGEYDSLGKPVPLVYQATGNVEGFGGYSHGIGHLLFFFEDIYDQRKSGDEFHPSGYWDLMGAGGRYFAWFMYLNGWISDDQVQCLPSDLSSATLNLTSTSKLAGKKLISVLDEPGKLLLIEYRTGHVDEDLLSDGVCNTSGCNGDIHEGLVIYFLDTTINHLNGPISVPKQYYSKTMLIGEKVSFKGYQIEFLAKGRKGAYVRVGRA